MTTKTTWWSAAYSCGYHNNVVVLSLPLSSSQHSDSPHPTPVAIIASYRSSTYPCCQHIHPGGPQRRYVTITALKWSQVYFCSHLSTLMILGLAVQPLHTHWWSSAPPILQSQPPWWSSAYPPRHYSTLVIFRLLL